MSLIPDVYREGEVDWLGMINGVVAAAGVADYRLPQGTASTLMAMNALAALSPDDMLESDGGAAGAEAGGAAAAVVAAAATRSMTEYAALLLTLDEATRRWPARLRALLTPPVTRVSPELEELLLLEQQRRHSSSGSKGAAVVPLVFATHPRPARRELVLFWFHACVMGFESGLEALARVRGDDAGVCLGPSAAKRGGRVSVSPSPPLPLPTAPGASARAAFRLLSAAAVHLAFLSSILDEGLYSCFPRGAEEEERGNRSPAESEGEDGEAEEEEEESDALAGQQLRSQLALARAVCVSALAARVAKYVYSVASAATQRSPMALAQLAYAAAVSPAVPAADAGGSSLSYVPTLMLAAYHLHRAQHYYQTTTTADGEPDVANALGHARYAETLLGAVAAEERRRAPPRAAGRGSRWGWLSKVASLLLLRGSGGGKGAVPPAEEEEEQSPLVGGEEEEEARLQSEVYGLLYRRLCGRRGGDADKEEEEEEEEEGGALGGSAAALRLLPVLPLLLRDVCALRRRLERENRVVYLRTVTPPATVRLDCPDVSAADAEERRALGERVARLRAAVEARRREHGAGALLELPTARRLRAALARQNEEAAAARAVLQGRQALRQLVEGLRTLRAPPAAVAEAVAALEPCYSAAPAAAEGPLPAALRLAGEVVGAAAGALRRQRLESRAVGAEAAAAALREADAWEARRAAVEEGWRTADRGLADARTAAQLASALTPPEPRAEDFARRAAAALRDESGAGGETTTHAYAARLQGLHAEGEALWAALAPQYTRERWAARLSLLEETRHVIWAAPAVVEALETQTSALMAAADRQSAEEAEGAAAQRNKATARTAAPLPAGKRPRPTEEGGARADSDGSRPTPPPPAALGGAGGGKPMWLVHDPIGARALIDWGIGVAAELPPSPQRPLAPPPPPPPQKQQQQHSNSRSNNNKKKQSAPKRESAAEAKKNKTAVTAHVSSRASNAATAARQPELQPETTPEQQQQQQQQQQQPPEQVQSRPPTSAPRPEDLKEAKVSSKLLERLAKKKDKK